jgi:hypothetical protein
MKEQVSVDLKHCAHCNCAAKLGKDEDNLFWVECENVFCQSNVKCLTSQLEAISAWNLRANGIDKSECERLMRLDENVKIEIETAKKSIKFFKRLRDEKSAEHCKVILDLLESLDK